MADEQIDFWDCFDSEVLTYETIDEAVEDWVERQYPTPLSSLGTWLEVTGYRLREIDTERLTGRVLEPFLEYLDEEYGNPNQDLDEPNMVMRAMEQMFIDTIVSEYTVWSCEVVATRKIDLIAWLQENLKGWPQTACDLCGHADPILMHLPQSMRHCKKCLARNLTARRC